jgi:cysteine desulfurase
VIYLDHNATTPLRSAVREAMVPWLGGAAGNPSSAHAAGRAARAAVERARRAIAAVIGAEPRQVFFTSGGTESNNLALFGRVGEPRGAHLVVSPLEHASVLGPVRVLAQRGASVTWLAPDADGRIDPDAVAAALRSDTALVTIGWANNEIGTIQPIAAIAAACRARRVPLHVDAVQALGKLAVDASATDLCSLSAHKLGGPVGIGVLVVRGAQLRPLAYGGEQERGLRPGTENVAGIVGFAAALASLPSRAALPALRERLWNGVATLPGARRHSPTGSCLDNTLSVGFAGLSGEALVAALDLEGVAVSVGSACAAGAGEPSHVLLALGCDEAAARAAIRFSLGPDTTGAEIDAAISAVRRVVARMRAITDQRSTLEGAAPSAPHPTA